MKQKVLDITNEQVDLMIRIKWGRGVRTANVWSHVSYQVIGKLFGIDGSSARRLILKRFDEIQNR